MTDQHRADCLGFMGHPCVQTPNLDALAAESVVFDHAFCQSPVCMASRGALFTGRYPAAIRIRGMGILPPSEITIAETLKRHGYHTGAFGKVHFTPEQYARNVLKSDVPLLDWKLYAEPAGLAPIPDDPCKVNYGFDVHIGCDDACQGLHREWVARRAPELVSSKPIRYTDDQAPTDLYVSPYPSEHHQSSFIADSCADFIMSQDRNPWFAFCSFVAPHHPFEAPADQIARYDLDSIPLPEHKCGVDAACIPPPIADAVGEMDKCSDTVKRRIVLHYLAAISLIDDNVGRVIQALRDTGQLDNTIIVFVADHGEFLGNRGLLRKPSMHYDEVMRVPLTIRVPDGAARRVSGLVELVDVMPTCLGLMGTPGSPGIQGRDWSDALRSGSEIGREDVYSDMADMDPMVCGQGGGPYGAACTLRTHEWKLTLYPTSGPQYGQLFDLSDDPDETANLYGDPGYRRVREEMTWRLFARAYANTDPLPLRLTQW